MEDHPPSWDSQDMSEPLLSNFSILAGKMLKDFYIFVLPNSQYFAFMLELPVYLLTFQPEIENLSGSVAEIPTKA
jgi:hypothetical protein